MYFLTSNSAGNQEAGAHSDYMKIFASEKST